ncbi:MAG: type III-B CRISPR module-associated protein Cmr5 [Pseudomonadota bacterium]|nr:type III-B CRISPR module-associated protein Cmr5 [Pseudomonadota bacterium]
MQQQRASFALRRVQYAIDKLSPDKRKEFKSYAAEFPFMIHANGLGQAAAFFLSKGKDKDSNAHTFLYNLLSDWLTKEGQPFAGKENLLKGITTSDMHTYQAAQAEAMVFMAWVKQFATAFIQDEKKPESQ